MSSSVRLDEFVIVISCRVPLLKMIRRLCYYSTALDEAMSYGDLTEKAQRIGSLPFAEEPRYGRRKEGIAATCGRPEPDVPGMKGRIEHVLSERTSASRSMRSLLVECFGRDRLSKVEVRREDNECPISTIVQTVKMISITW